MARCTPVCLWHFPQQLVLVAAFQFAGKVWLCACFHREVITEQAMLTTPEECGACTSSHTCTRTRTHTTQIISPPCATLPPPIQATSNNKKKPQSNGKFSMTFSQESISRSGVILCNILVVLSGNILRLTAYTAWSTMCMALQCTITIKSEFFFYPFVEETLSETHSSQKASLFPLLVNSQCVCWLAPALCWLSHSPNCPWALWNSQPIWLKTCTHISKHCIDWNRGSEWTARGDLIAFWKRSSRRKASISGRRERWQRRITLFLCKWNQCIELGHCVNACVWETER